MMASSSINKMLFTPQSPDALDWESKIQVSYRPRGCLSLEWFRSRREARVAIEAWRRHYNTLRPHSSLDYLTPHEFKKQYHSIPNLAVLQE